jgi:arylsulfatase A-like enzyme
MAQPNFLLFVTDQHRVDYLGCYGHPILRTPHIDSIAARGIRFERFYVATPVCMPNRATLMTGRMPSVHGARSNGLPLSLRANTFVDALRASGYATALVGKSHLQNFTGHPPILKRPPGAAGQPAARFKFYRGLQISIRWILRPRAPEALGSRSRFFDAIAILWL